METEKPIYENHVNTAIKKIQKRIPINHANEIIDALYSARLLSYFYKDKNPDYASDMKDNLSVISETYYHLFGKDDTSDVSKLKYTSDVSKLKDTSDVGKLKDILDVVFEGKELREIPKKEDDDEVNTLIERFYKMMDGQTLSDKKCKNEITGEIEPPPEKLQGLDQEWSVIQTRLFMTMKYKNVELESGKLVSMLMYGFPGTGKTHLARIISDCLGTYFLSISSSQIKSKYMGESSKNVKALFEAARKKYKDGEGQNPQPKVTIFLDEFDGLVGISEAEGGGQSDIVTEFLTEMEGVQEDQNAGLILIAATNRPTKIPSNIMSRFTTSIRLALPYPPITKFENDELQSLRKNELPLWVENKMNNFNCKSPAQLIKTTMERYHILGDLIDENKSEKCRKDLDNFILYNFTPMSNYNDSGFNIKEIDEYPYISQRSIVNFVTHILWPHLVKEAQGLLKSDNNTNWSMVTIDGKRRLIPNIPDDFKYKNVPKRNVSDFVADYVDDLTGSYIDMETLKVLMYDNKSQIETYFKKDEITEIYEMNKNWEPDKICGINPHEEPEIEFSFTDQSSDSDSSY